DNASGNAASRERGRDRNGDIAGETGTDRRAASEPAGVMGQLSKLADAAAEGFRRAARRLREGVEAVAHAAGPVAKRAALPALLIGFSVFFFFLQDLFDRRDPKLALAPLRRTEALSFSPPPAEVART
ncbi:MAG: hypothetical protein M3P40_04530, partial [Actinomycetota bacterium]|nr:hypothetical protein [Actinomycetota bacterium]